MSLRAAHACGMTATVVLATLTVLCGGALPAWAWAFAAAPILWPLWHHVATPLAPRAANVLAAAGVAVPLAYWLAQGRAQGVQAACVALLWVLAVRQASRTLPSHDLQALVLALLLVCVGAIVNPTPSYALLLLPFAFAMVAALVTRQLVHDVAMAAFRDHDAAAAAAQLGRTDVVTGRFVAVIAGLSLSLLLMAGAVFAAFPRVGLPAWGGGNARGLPQAVDLGRTPWSAGPGQIVARVWGLGRNAYAFGLYLRGRSYDRVDAQGFAESNLAVPIRALAADGQQFSYAVVQDAAEGDPLLTLGPIERGLVSTSDNNVVQVGRSSGGEQPPFVAAAAGSHRAQLTGRVSRSRPPALPAQGAGDAHALAAHDAAFAAHYTALPEALRARLAPLVAQVVGPATGFAERAARLRQYLGQNYAYDAADVVGPSRRGDEGPLLRFVFDVKRGNCTYFASAFAALLRASGVPSRVVGGFEGGRWDGDEQVALFTGAHAHAWVEWYLPGTGWVVDDATPARGEDVLAGWAMWRERMGRFWQLDVLQFGLANQLGFVHGVQLQLASLRQLAFPGRAGGAVGRAAPGQLAAGGLALAAVAFGLWRLAGRRAARARHRLARLLHAEATRRLGRPLRPDETLRGALAAAAASPGAVGAGPSPQVLERALACYEAMRFGGVAAPAELPELVRALAQRDNG